MTEWPGPQQIEILDPCDCGRHKLEPRYDFAKAGNIVERTYLCDVCAVCGHQVPRPFTVQQQLDAGIVSREEVRHAMAILAGTGGGVGEEQLPALLRHLIMLRDTGQQATEEPS